MKLQWNLRFRKITEFCVVHVAIGTDADLETGVGGGGGGWRGRDEASEKDAAPLDLTDELPVVEIGQEADGGRGNGQSRHHHVGYGDVDDEHVTCTVPPFNHQSNNSSNSSNSSN